MVSGLEAVADAIMQFEGWAPGSRSYANRNPGNLRASDGTFLVFFDLPHGYAALVNDLEAKFSGHNSHGLGPNSTLLDLFNIYAPSSDGNPTLIYAQFVGRYCWKALGRQLTEKSLLRDIWEPTLPSASTA